MNLDDPKLTAYALGEFTGEERQAIEAALRDDPEARAFVEETASFSQLLCEEFHAETPQASLAPAQRSEVFEQARNAGRTVSFNRSLFMGWALRIAALAVLGAAIVQLFAPSHRRKPGQPPQDALALLPAEESNAVALAPAKEQNTLALAATDESLKQIAPLAAAPKPAELAGYDADGTATISLSTSNQLLAANAEKKSVGSDFSRQDLAKSDAMAVVAGNSADGSPLQKPMGGAFQSVPSSTASVSTSQTNAFQSNAGQTGVLQDNIAQNGVLQSNNSLNLTANQSNTVVWRLQQQNFANNDTLNLTTRSENGAVAASPAPSVNGPADGKELSRARSLHPVVTKSQTQYAYADQAASNRIGDSKDSATKSADKSAEGKLAEAAPAPALKKTAGTETESQKMETASHTLAGSNTYTGTTTVSGGALALRGGMGDIANEKLDADVRTAQTSPLPGASSTPSDPSATSAPGSPSAPAAATILAKAAPSKGNALAGSGKKQGKGTGARREFASDAVVAKAKAPTEDKPAATEQKFVTITQSADGTAGVKSPGRVAWSSDLTLTQAIAGAGGLGWREPREIVILRGDTKIVAHPPLIQKGAEPDPKLQPGDIIKLP